MTATPATEETDIPVVLSERTSIALAKEYPGRWEMALQRGS